MGTLIIDIDCSVTVIFIITKFTLHKSTTSRLKPFSAILILVQAKSIQLVLDRGT